MKENPKCHCGRELRTKLEKNFDMCNPCLNQIGVPTRKSKVPFPKGSHLNDPRWTNMQAFDRLLWLMDWWVITVEQCSPEDVEYVAKRLEELAVKMRRSI